MITNINNVFEGDLGLSKVTKSYCYLYRGIQCLRNVPG